MDFDYSNLTIQGFGDEERFVKNVEWTGVEKANTNARRGDMEGGEAIWESIKEETYEAIFIDKFKDYLEGSGVQVKREVEGPHICYTGPFGLDGLGPFRRNAGGWYQE